MPRDKRRQYEGALGRPLSPRRDIDPKRALAERIDALFQEYAIERSDGHAWERLALALAFRHVPGFKIPSTGADIRRSSGTKSGPPMELNSAELSYFIEEVEKLVSGRAARTIKEACNLLASRGGRPFRLAAKQLEERYYRHRHKLRKEPRMDWSRCLASSTAPCIRENMELEACLRGCQHPDTCPLFAALTARLEKGRTANSAVLEQLARVLIWRTKQDWASPRFALERRARRKARRDLRNP
jgi:hypothetical protein